jgi:hypothetical protein
MSGQRLAVLLVALGLIGGTALALGRVKSWQRLGPPGVRVVAELMPGVEVLPGGTNRTFVAGTNSVYLPAQVLDFTSQARPVDKVVYDWLPLDTTYGQRLYQAPDGFQVLGQVVLMGTDRTSMHQPQACLPGQGWRIESTEQVTLEMDRPRPYTLPITQLVLSATWKRPEGQPEVRHGLFLYWYVTADELTANARTGMWSQARKLMRTGELQRWAYVSYFTVCAPGQEKVCRERVRRLIRAAVPEFQLFPPAASPTSRAPAPSP